MRLSTQSIKNRLKSMALEYIKRVDIVHVLDYAGHKIYLCENVRLASCRKEPETVRWIEGFNRADTVFDIGANVGTYTLIMSLYAKVVYAFDPAAINFSLLCKNLAANIARGTCGDNVIPLNVALADRVGIETLNYANTRAGGSGHQVGKSTDRSGVRLNSSHHQSVLCYSIDRFVEAFGLKVPDHIKIDVDGSEWEVIQGAEQTLASSDVKSVLIEAREGTPEQARIDDMMQSKGFRLRSRFSLSSNTQDCNYLYVHH